MSQHLDPDDLEQLVSSDPVEDTERGSCEMCSVIKQFPSTHETDDINQNDRSSSRTWSVIRQADKVRNTLPCQVGEN